MNVIRFCTRGGCRNEIFTLFRLLPTPTGNGPRSTNLIHRFDQPATSSSPILIRANTRVSMSAITSGASFCELPTQWDHFSPSRRGASASASALGEAPSPDAQVFHGRDRAIVDRARASAQCEAPCRNAQVNHGWDMSMGNRPTSWELAARTQAREWRPRAVAGVCDRRGRSSRDSRDASQDGARWRRVAVSRRHTCGP
jgi:hypothetical protein